MGAFEKYGWEEEKIISKTGLRYLVRLQDYVLKNSQGKEEAVMFSFSYLRIPQDSRRPVMFAYNGGPGAASSWIHMGLLGPKQISFPDYPNLTQPIKYQIQENEEFLLDQCDLVLIDPVGASWSRLLDESTASRHYSTGGDARDFAEFIENWLTENGRKDVPVYLLGESYGTIRNVALADALSDWVNLCGMIHIGTSLNVGAKGSLCVEPNVRRLGANAAACWYHHHQKECSREKFIREAMEFAYGDYARALLLGNRMEMSEREKVLKRLSYYTGISEDFLRKRNLRFGEIDFVLHLCPGKVVSIYDSRLLYQPEQGQSYSENVMTDADIVEPDMAQDAFMSSVGPAVETAFDDYCSMELCLPTGRKKLDAMLEISKQWDYRGYEKDTLSLPVELMKRKPCLRMMFVNGCYDLSSTFDFMTYYLSQYELPSDRVTCLVLPPGHASYVGGDTVQQLSRKIRKFISWQGE